MHDQGDGVFIPDNDIVVCRLDDFYFKSTECEFEDCQSTAVHHCCDTTLYWGGCGRLFCEEHSRGSKSTSDDTLAYICIECHESTRRWQCYSFCILFLVIILFLILWEISLSGTIAKTISESLSGK